jgi:integrase
MTKEKKPPRGVRRRGDSLFVIFALKDGTLERRSVGPISIREAVEKREIFKRQVRLGTYEKAKPRPPKKTSFVVADLWDGYLLEYRNQGKRDAGRLEIAWNHLKAMFQKMPVEDMTTSAVNQYILSRRAQGIQNGTINRETATLRAMFHHGMRVTPPMVTHLPAFPARLKEPLPRKGFITDVEYTTLKANTKLLWLRTLIACSYTFGFRKGELLNLHVRQVDLLDRWLELEEGSTKTGEARKIKMSGEVYELLLACVSGKSPDDFVFTRSDGSRVVDPRDEWYSLCVASGLGRWEPAKRGKGEDYMQYVGLNLYDFRRSAIRNMTRRGISETVAMKISGHKTASVFRRYNITDLCDLAEATNKIEAGRSVPAGGTLVIPALKSDTKSDTSSFPESRDSRNSLN